MRFFSALERARRLITLRQNALNQREKPAPDAGQEAARAQPLRRFAVRNGRELTFVETTKIDWIEAAGDYAQLHTDEKTYLIRESLNTLETLLDRNDFLRIHRSAIIQLDRIARITALANRDGYLTLRNGTSLRVSRSYSKPLKDRLRNRKIAES
jgi:two-component system LytT family response regulator